MEQLTPKEKAEELVSKYALELKEHSGYYDFETARNCALIAVEFARKYGICEDQKQLNEIQSELEKMQ